MGGNPWDVDSPEERLRRILDHLNAAAGYMADVRNGNAPSAEACLNAWREVICAANHAHEAMAEITAGEEDHALERYLEGASTAYRDHVVLGECGTCDPEADRFCPDGAEMRRAMRLEAGLSVTEPHDYIVEVTA